MGRPVSANSDVQSTVAAVVDTSRLVDVSTCVGTANKPSSRPLRSNVNESMPERVSDGFTRVTMLVPPMGVKGRGLWRYQKISDGGWAAASRYHRDEERSFSSMCLR